MSARVRENGLWTLAAAGATALVAWIGLAEFGWSDYEHEAGGSVSALLHGHLGTFFALAPAYGGSLLERAPFAFVTRLWGGGQLAAFRLLALPCLLAALVFGLWLAARMRREHRTRLACALALGLCVANPLTLGALEIGHPEELLGGVLCVVAVLLASRGKAAWAGVVLGIAIASKQWALVAVGPVLVALPARRWLCLVLAAGVSAALLCPFLLFAPSGFIAKEGVATSSGAEFGTAQVWWFFGHVVSGGHLAAGAAAAAGAAQQRVAPGWVTTLSHPLIVGLTLPLSLATWLIRREDGAGRYRRVSLDGALLLLALLLLLRCMLDPWDNIYYPIPFVLALLTWETLAKRRAPVLALASAMAVWLGRSIGMVPGLPSVAADPDVFAAAFLVLTLPLASFLALRLYRRPQSSTVSSRGSSLRLRAPSAVTSSRSSILTPSSPGR